MSSPCKAIFLNCLWLESRSITVVQNALHKLRKCNVEVLLSQQLNEQQPLEYGRVEVPQSLSDERKLFLALRVNRHNEIDHLRQVDLIILQFFLYECE